MKRIVIIVLALAVVLGIAFFLFGPKFNKKEDINKPITLTIYGLWEDENFIKPIIEAYKKVKPNVTIKYVYQSSINYQKRVQTQIDSGEGPDIFMLHNSWVPVFLRSKSLSELPPFVMKLDEYSQTFYPVAKETLSNYQSIKQKIDANSTIGEKQSELNKQFNKDGKIYAIPRGIDGLALYYNEDILKAAGASVPKTWDEFRNTAIKLTTVDPKGEIITAGAAIGATGNVDHWPDIVGLLFLQQPGANLEKPNSPLANDPNKFPGVDVLKFYTNFITKPNQKVWDTNLGNSTQAFSAGKVAFYFGPSWRAYEIHSANPNLNFKTAPVPQLPGNPVVSWATFWAYAVSVKSSNQVQSWEFLKFLTSKDTEKILYQEASKIRLFGLPYSRVDLQKELLEDPIVGAYVSQGQSYKSWYLASKTQDEGGLDSEMIKYYEDAINSTLQGSDPKNALDTTAKGVQQVLDTFVNSPTPAPSKR